MALFCSRKGVSLCQQVPLRARPSRIVVTACSIHSQTISPCFVGHRLWKQLSTVFPALTLFGEPKNPECESVRDFYFFTFHFSLFTLHYLVLFLLPYLVVCALRGIFEFRSCILTCFSKNRTWTDDFVLIPGVVRRKALHTDFRESRVRGILYPAVSFIFP